MYYDEMVDKADEIAEHLDEDTAIPTKLTDLKDLLRDAINEHEATKRKNHDKVKEARGAKKAKAKEKAKAAKAKAKEKSKAESSTRSAPSSKKSHQNSTHSESVSTTSASSKKRKNHSVDEANDDTGNDKRGKRGRTKKN
jgi:hypothetical protein